MNTTEAFRKRIEDLITEYLEMPEGAYRPDGTLHEKVVEWGIWKLIGEDILTKRELQQEAMKYDVVLPRQYIEQCVAKWERIREIKESER